MNIFTKAVHAGDRRKPGPHVPVTTPVTMASSYIYESIQQLDEVFAQPDSGYCYSRYDNPTNSALEELVTVLENGHGTLACASGMAALNAAIQTALLDRPKRIVAADAMYGATISLLNKVLDPFGVSTTYVDICDLAAVEQAIAAEKPGCVLMETISNPLLRVGAIDRIAAAARKANAALVVDNTFATPLLVRPLELGAQPGGPQRDEIPGRTRRRIRRTDYVGPGTLLRAASGVAHLRPGAGSVRIVSDHARH